MALTGFAKNCAARNAIVLDKLRVLGVDVENAIQKGKNTAKNPFGHKGTGNSYGAVADELNADAAFVAEHGLLTRHAVGGILDRYRKNLRARQRWESEAHPDEPDSSALLEAYYHDASQRLSLAPERVRMFSVARTKVAA